MNCNVFSAWQISWTNHLVVIACASCNACIANQILMWAEAIWGRFFCEKKGQWVQEQIIHQKSRSFNYCRFREIAKWNQKNIIHPMSYGNLYKFLGQFGIWTCPNPVIIQYSQISWQVKTLPAFPNLWGFDQVNLRFLRASRSSRKKRMSKGSWPSVQFCEIGWSKHFGAKKRKKDMTSWLVGLVGLVGWCQKGSSPKFKNVQNRLLGLLPKFRSQQLQGTQEPRKTSFEWDEPPAGLGVLNACWRSIPRYLVTDYNLSYPLPNLLNCHNLIIIVIVYDNPTLPFSKF